MKKIIWAIVGVIVIVVLITSFSKNSNKDIKIGLISILSGEYSVVGENFRNGAILANEQYNLTHSDKVDLIIEDDGFDTGKALSAYKKLTGIDNIDALINVSTPSIGAIYNDVVKAGIPVIQGGEQPIVPANDNIFQIMPGNIPLEKELGKYLLEKNFKNPVVVFTQHDTMIRFKNAFLEGYGKSMKEFTAGQADTDYRTLVSKISVEKPDLIVFLVFPQQGAQIISEYKKQNTSMPQMAFDASAQSGFSDYARILGSANVLNGSIIATIQQDVSKEFIDAYKKRFGSEPGFFADLGYDGFNILVNTRDNDKSKWVDNMKNVSFSGATGQIAFDDAGVRLPVTKIVVIKDGQIPKE